MTTANSIAVALLAILVLSCRGARQEKSQVEPEPIPASPGGRHDARPAGHPYTEADVRFISDMIDHHAQALVMAGWAPTHGASSSIRVLAERIINGQLDEIATMQRWLRDRGHPVPEPGDSGSMKHGQHHPSASPGQAPAAGSELMPGMLTEAQMRELDQARGTEFDRLFLKYMIQHHQGAVTMVNRLFNTPGAAREQSVFKLASDVSADQTSEISRMERMLAETRSPGGS